MRRCILIESVGILIPTRARHVPLLDSLLSLSKCDGAKELMDVVVLSDQDTESFAIASEFSERQNFRTYRAMISQERLLPVRAFVHLYNTCPSKYFCFMNDENIYEKDWLIRALDRFKREFPDDIGLLSLFKKKKAGLCLTTKDFVKYNEGEIYYPGYKLYYSDDELTMRAILLGRYAWQENSGVFHDNEITVNVPTIPWEEKIRLKKIDRGLFYKRAEHNFGLPEDKIYKWTGFREINLPIRRESLVGRPNEG